MAVYIAISARGAAVSERGTKRHRHVVEIYTSCYKELHDESLICKSLVGLAELSIK